MGLRLFSKFSILKPIILAANYNVKMATKTAILLLAEGAEEMEAVTTTDILRRAGVQVTIASMTDDKCVKCSRDVKICADTTFKDATKDKDYDVIVLPGGVGYKILASSSDVGRLLQEQRRKKKGLIAAICAAPVVLKIHGIGKGAFITSYPGMKKELENDYIYAEDTQEVAISHLGDIITSRGPSTSIDFGLAIVEKLLGKQSALTVAKEMLYTNYRGLSNFEGPEPVAVE